VFDRQPEIGANPAGPRLTAVGGGIEFRNVCFKYHADADNPTLDGINLTVKPGETIAIVGPNGCGKTTLLGLLPRFYDPCFGMVLIDGVNVRSAQLRSLRKLIGIVTQDTQLFDDTVLANIAYGKKRATRDEVIAAAKRAHAHDFIEKELPAGYDTRLGEMAGKISGGQRQRIALARAFLRDPAILILDEFTSQVDPRSEAEIHAALKEFVRGSVPAPEPASEPGQTPGEPAVPDAIITPEELEPRSGPAPERGGETVREPHRPARTTFLITHRLHTLPEIADRVVVMDAGTICHVGTHAELMASCEVYQRLHLSAQFRKAA
jgi:ATP-binding cassette subfamily B protein/subfamily B ATP-binding cassette protein MsbA